ncbi:MAG: toprim domain-containing protein, partial [Sarcina sp.]
MSFVEKYEMVLADIPASEVEAYIASELGLDKKNGKYRCIWHNHKNPYKVTFYESGKFFKCHDTAETEVVYGLRNLLQDHKGMSAKEVLSFMDSYFCGGKFASAATGSNKVNTAQAVLEAQRKMREIEEQNKKHAEYTSKMVEIKAILSKGSHSNAIAWLKQERSVEGEIEQNMPILKMGNDICYLYKQLDGEVVNVKIRKPNKHFETIKAADHFLLYNFENCKNHKEPLYLVEGEADCLALYSLGYQVATMGASNATKLINDNFNEINKFNQIVLMMDNDEAGEVAKNKIKELFPRALEIRKEYYYGLKDANDILKLKGKDKLIETIQNGVYMGDNVVNAKNVTTTKEIGKRVKTVFEDLNAIIGAW